MTKQNNFDGLRLIGAMMVLVSHQFALSGRVEPHVVGDVSWGAFGVLIFFSISGLLVGQSWLDDPDVGRFSQRRLLRIWPGLAAVVLVASAAALIVAGDFARVAYLANLLLFSVATVLPMAWLSWHFVESPALRLKPRRARGDSPAANDAGAPPAVGASRA